MSDDAVRDETIHPNDWTLLRKLWPFVRPHSLMYVLALCIAPVTAGLSIVQPYLLKVALDDHIAVGDLAGTRWIAMGFLAAVLFAWVAEGVYLYLLSLAALGTITDLRSAVYQRTIGLALGFFDRQPKGRLLTRATSDIEALGETLSAGAVTIVLDVLNVSGVLVAMLLIDAYLTAVMLVMAPIILVVVEVLRRILRKLYYEVRTSLADLNAFTTERINGVEVVQLYNDEERAMTAYDQRLYRYRDATIRTNIYDASLYAIIDGLSAITVALMLWYGSGGLLEGTLTAGLLAAFIAYIDRLFRPIQEFSAKVAVFQRASSAMAKIFGLLDVDDHITEGEQRLMNPVGELVIDDLSFAYGDGPLILKGVSLQLHPGEVVAVVGRTGSGKTTLGRVLTRAYDGYHGSVTLDGHELTTLRIEDVRRTVGTVLQDVQLFPGDVRLNLTMGADVSDERIRQAVEQTHSEEVVARLGGFDGTISHKGANLSVGEAQLLSFARTLIFDAPVVIMDEATANVDTLTEAKIQAATDVILREKTVLVIAHRLSTIINADRICVMDAGRVVESGSHSELLAMGGMYADLFAQQFGDEEVDA
ncbi:MAG: ABC transporter ATP-binding protein [Myxococcota bacterium]